MGGKMFASLYGSTTHHFLSARWKDIQRARSLLIISPQALRNCIPSRHTGASNFPISLFPHFFLRSFAHLSRPHASRVKEVLVTEAPRCGVPTRTIRYSRQSTTRKRAIEIPSYEFRKWGFPGRTEEGRKRTNLNRRRGCSFKDVLRSSENTLFTTRSHTGDTLRHTRVLNEKLIKI